MTRSNAYRAILIVSILTIAGAWIFQWMGYAPCPLCLKQRWAWYGALVLAAVFAIAMPQNGWGLAALALVFAGSAVFGVYHSGVEFGWWQGPTTCAGDLSGGLLPELTNEPVISCEKPALLVFGLSLASWNAILSAGLAALALKAQAAR